LGELGVAEHTPRLIRVLIDLSQRNQQGTPIHSRILRDGIGEVLEAEI
jgi:hypothetical protein